MINHLALILDGNRRFAKHIMKNPWEGHRIGLDKARQAIEWTCNHGIKYITAYVLSYENLKTRPALELNYIFKYLEDELDCVLEDKTHIVNRNNIKVNFIGRTDELPIMLREKLGKVAEHTKNNSEFVLNIALAYGGQQEVVDAVKHITEKAMKGILSPAQLNEDVIKEHLYTNGQPFPDLIIRTGGEKRLSNFLPFQSVYSELMFFDKHWPEMEESDFLEAFKEFENRKRRFGN
ncbi:MAG: di-trans,poly-cis-decaprenylcistransferase [Candidatus Aenigmarchaeota archaeon]|nr:di-trans,poly-cis-decaprenylcistransferase [Candidatus Aenigmarchaeota archaeon]